MSATLGSELVRATLEQVGKPAILHWKLAGNCLSAADQTLPACMEVGLGPDQFDCSGLVINSVCKVFDIDTSSWPSNLRHVRQMYQTASDESANSGLELVEAGISEGDLLVERRNYRIENGKRITLAGHIGVVAQVRKKSVSMIHATNLSGTVSFKEVDATELSFAEFIRVKAIPISTQH